MTDQHHHSLGTAVVLSLVCGISAALSCRHGSSAPPANPPITPLEDRCVMTKEYEARIVRHIVEFETTEHFTPALYAANELTGRDAYAPPSQDAESRAQARLRRVVLWGRLFRAIDTRRDPRYDRAKPPSWHVEIDEADMPEPPQNPTHGSAITIDTLPDPAARKKYQDLRAKAAQEGAWYSRQRELDDIDRQVSRRGEDYFKSVFVRSNKGLAVVESCAQSGGWTAARLARVRAWVAPER